MIMKRRFYVLAFLIPIVTWLAIFAVWGQYPFGDKTLLIWDANFQFVSFFAKWHDILHGKAGFFYSLSDSLGGNIYSIGAYYYLFSPLHLLTFFFKKESLYKCLCLIFFIKTGFMGVSLFHYLMGIQLPEGIHTVRLKYYPPGLGIGFVISMICCGLFALFI